MTMPVYNYVIIDGHYYVVQNGTYLRKWQRQFTATLAANIVELNFIDRGPGIKTYNLTLLLSSWDPSSTMYKLIFPNDSAIADINLQRQNLEASYGKIATQIQLVDPFGESPPGGLAYFTSLIENIPPYSSIQKPYISMDVELIGSSAI